MGRMDLDIAPAVTAIIIITAIIIMGTTTIITTSVRRTASDMESGMVVVTTSLTRLIPAISTRVRSRGLACTLDFKL
jgi:hypothetical protein